MQVLKLNCTILKLINHNTRAFRRFVIFGSLRGSSNPRPAHMLAVTVLNDAGRKMYPFGNDTLVVKMLADTLHELHLLI